MVLLILLQEGHVSKSMLFVEPNRGSFDSFASMREECYATKAIDFDWNAEYCKTHVFYRAKLASTLCLRAVMLGNLCVFSKQTVVQLLHQKMHTDFRRLRCL